MPLRGLILKEEVRFVAVLDLEMKERVVKMVGVENFEERQRKMMRISEREAYVSR